MSCEYGGNTQDTIPDIGASHLQAHGLDDFMYLSLDFNPNAPTFPGFPGFFSSMGPSDGQSWPTIQRTFIRKAPNKWLYIGQYELSPAMSLTPEEFELQPAKVKNTWSWKILKKDWATGVRVSIILRRRLGREPKNEEIEAALATNHKYYDITQEEIIGAFERGEETIGLWFMKCIDYDEDFQRRIARKFPTWVPPPPRPRKDKSKPKKASASKAKATKQVEVGTKRKFKQEEEEVSEEEEDDQLEDDEEDAEDGTDMPRHLQNQYTPRGTRSRPDAAKKR